MKNNKKPVFIDRSREIVKLILKQVEESVVLSSEDQNDQFNLMKKGMLSH